MTVIGITTGPTERPDVVSAFTAAVLAAGGVPLLLPTVIRLISTLIVAPVSASSSCLSLSLLLSPELLLALLFGLLNLLALCLTTTVLRHSERAGWLKDVRPSGDDLREGLVAVVSIKIPEPSFET